MSKGQIDQMFSVREMPWHRDGLVPDDYPQTWDEARKWAGLDWEPEQAPVYDDPDYDVLRQVYADIVMSADYPDEAARLDALVAATRASMVPVPDFKRVIRRPNPGAEPTEFDGRTLSCTTEGYAIINHTAFGEIFDAVLKQEHVRAETGGCMDGGRKVWMLVKLDEPIAVPGDKSLVMPYAALTGRHDAKGAVVLRSTAVRIVCGNTFRAAEMEGDRTGLTFSFAHHKNWRDRIPEAREAIMGVKQEMRDWVELAESLLGVKVTPEQTQLFVRAFIPDPPDGLITDRVAKNIDEARRAVLAILEGPTVDGAGVGGTAYGLVQAAGEYLDHVRTAKTWETKLGRTIIRPEPLKAKATKLALEVAAS